ncbi:hypothetical protein H1R20_g6047, partial [Candolleomyces eurysporus]
MALSASSHLTAVEAHVSESDNSTLSPTPDIDLKDMKRQVEENVYPAGESVPEFPDGGFWAWSTVAGAFLVQYCTFGYINAFGVYQDYYVRIYLTHYTPSTIGWIGGMQIFLNFGMGVVTGRLFDRGYFRYLMATSIVLHAIALFMLSLSHENKYYQHEFALALATCIFTFFALFFPVFYLQLNAITHGVDKNIAFYSLSILNACSVIGRLVPNAIAHKFGISNLIVLFTFLTGAVTLTFPAVKNLEGTILFAIFWGFVSGAFIALVPAYINIMSKDPSETGTRLGLFFGVGSIIGLFGKKVPCTSLPVGMFHMQS